MPKKKSYKPRSYFSGTVDEAVHNSKTFTEGDRVKIRSVDIKKWPDQFGKVVKLIHGNHGQGRIYADVACDDGKVRREPLGRLKKI